MRIAELKNAMDFVKEMVIDKEIPGLFANLISILQQNARMQPGQQPQPITQQKTTLIGAVKAVKPEVLSLNERQLLAKYIDLGLMGESGVKTINQVFADHNLDPMGAVNAFQKMAENYDSLVKSAKQTLKVLDTLDVEVLEPDIDEGSAVLQVTFKEKASISNVTDWHDYSDNWWQIVRSFGLLTNTTTDQAKILSFQQGSLIVEIGAAYALIKGIGLAADKTLSVIEHLLDLRKKISEIKQLDLTNKQIERDLEKEADSFQENKVAQIAKQVIAEINKPKLEDGETVTAIQMSVNKLFLFLDKGGTVDCRLPQIENETPEVKELRGVYSKIRALETRIDHLKLLTNGEEKPEDGEAGQF